MVIREERPADAAAARKVHKSAFGDDGAGVADLADALRETLTESDGLGFRKPSLRIPDDLFQVHPLGPAALAGAPR